MITFSRRRFFHHCDSSLEDVFLRSVSQFLGVSVLGDPNYGIEDYKLFIRFNSVF